MDKSLIDICQKKIDKQIDLSWDEIAEKYGYRNGELLRQKFKKWRKNNGVLPTREIVVDKNIENKLNEIDLKELNLKKERYKIKDQKSQLNKIIRQQARYEYILEVIEDSIKNSNLKEFKPVARQYINSSNDLLVYLCDAHFGININNYWNTYNPDVFVERLEKYYNEILDIKRTHNAKDCYLYIGGDLCSGFIHKSIRAENVENTISQIQKVSEYISQFTYELAKEFSNVYICSVSGNHTRIFEDKDESLKDERYDVLTIWYMKARLMNLNNVFILDNEIDSTIGSFNIRGKLYYFVHGDLDRISNVANNLTLMTGVKPYAIGMGHGHHYACDTSHDVKIIMSGSIVGTDSYAIEKRLTGSPSQTVCVCNDKGILCNYDVILK